MFSSAGGKPISVSEESMARADTIVDGGREGDCHLPRLCVSATSPNEFTKALRRGQDGGDNCNDTEDKQDIHLVKQSQTNPLQYNADVTECLRTDTNLCYSKCDNNLQEGSVMIPRSTKRKSISSLTPMQTPFQRHSALVTRSLDTGKNIRKKIRMDLLHAPMTPVPFNVPVVDATFKESTSITTTHESPLKGNEHYVQQLIYGKAKKFLFTWSGRKIPLTEFAERYGPLEISYQSCIEANVSEIVCSVTSDNSSRLRFDASGYPIVNFGQHMSSGVKVRGNVNDLRTELVRCGCAATNLNDMWIANHYRWIVWKLAAMERRFPTALAHQYLTYDHVVHQLRKRFQKEIEEAKRPVLRKVLNRDISSSIAMILCVSKILGIGEATPIKLHLTDGWYEVPALIDEQLQELVRKEKIIVGSKILVCNALLEGADEGVDPLDKFYKGNVRSFSIRLKLFANCSRLCIWSAKLGYLKPTKSIIARGGLFGTNAIKDIIPGGGPVPSIDLIVCKKYPTLYMEETAVVGSAETLKRTITEAENSASRKAFEDKRNRMAEKLTEAVQTQCMKVSKQHAVHMFFTNRYIWYH
jgi:hypothetical protein